MKKIFFALIFIVSSLSINAQDDEIQTLFGSQALHIGGFGGPFMSFTTIDGQFAHMMGGGGGIIMNNFFIGGYGVGLTNSIPYLGSTDERINFGHGGFWLGYNFASRKLVHPAFHLQIGWGSVKPASQQGDPLRDGDNVFVLVPTIEAEMNITKYFKLGVGGDYRAVFQANGDYSSGDLSGPGIFLSFKFGSF